MDIQQLLVASKQEELSNEKKEKMKKKLFYDNSSLTMTFFKAQKTGFLKKRWQTTFIQTTMLVIVLCGVKLWEEGLPWQ